MKKVLQICLVMTIAVVSTSVSAVTVNWADWQTYDNNNVHGTITTSTSSVSVSYNNPQGVAFVQTGSGTDYYQNHRGVDGSPYTSTLVENIPTASELIGLLYAGSQTLTFSETIANPFFSYVSLNGNGYAFDQDFDILSFGSASDGNYCGYWGCGTSYKEIVEIATGVYEYRLLGTGEPHGTIRFTGAFDTVSWRSLSNEYWNGFTVGIEGTAEEIFPEGEAPIPNPLVLMGIGLAAIGFTRKRKA